MATSNELFQDPHYHQFGNFPNLYRDVFPSTNNHLEKNKLLDEANDVVIALRDTPTFHPKFIYNSSLDELNQVNNSIADDCSEFDGNIWTVFDEKFLKHSLGWTFVLVIAYTLVLIAGVIGNSMVILVVMKRPQMRNVTNMFVMNLAVADLLVTLFCVPATLLSNVFIPWILGSVMCKGVAYVQGVSVCASAYSLVAISLDRCKAIYSPLDRHGGLSKRQALFIICLIWFITLVLIIPWAIIFDVVVSKKDGNPYCIETWKNETHGNIYYLVANLFCCYSLPLILISISNIIIWCHVSNRQLPQDAASAAIVKQIHQRTRHGVRKMLGIVTFAFLMSWLPLYVLVTRLKFAKNIGAIELSWILKLLPFAQWLGGMNSSINPILYAFLNNKFRDMFKSLLPAWMPFVQRGNPTFTYTVQPNFVNRNYIPMVTDLSTRQTTNVDTTNRLIAADSCSSTPRSGNFRCEERPKSLIVSSLGNGDMKTISISASSNVSSLCGNRLSIGHSARLTTNF